MGFLRSVPIAFSVSLLGMLALSQQAPAQSAEPKPLAILKLEPYRKSVAVRVNVNGKPGLFTVDTAGGMTVVSPYFAKQVGCTPWGQLVGYTMTGTRLASPRCDNFDFTVDGVKLHAPSAAVLDVAPMVAKDAEPIEGLLALDVFAGRTITFDPAAGKLIIESPESALARIEGARELPMKIAREAGGVALAAYVEVPTTKGVLRFEIDSGNGGTLLVSKPNAALLGLDPEAKDPADGEFEVAPGLKAKGLIFIKDLNIDGNLGMPFLKDYAVTLDLKAGRMWIQRSRSVPPPGMGTAPQIPKS